MSAVQETEGKTLNITGRIVWGPTDLFKGRPMVDQDTNRPIIDEKTGQQKIQYGFGLAVPKAHFAQAGEAQDLWNAMLTQAAGLYGNQLPPDFAWKFKDGDTRDHNGANFSDRDGYAGHMIFAMTTMIAIKWFKWDQGQQTNVQITEGIKVGDFVQVQVQVKAHGPKGRGKAGLYLNPLCVRFAGFGEAIINAPSGNEIFGSQAPALPPGASSTPVGMSMPMPGAAPMGMPMQQQPMAMPQTQVAPPNFAVLPQAHQPVAQSMGNAMPMPGAPPVTPQAQGFAPQTPQFGGPMQPGPAVMPGAFPSNGMPGAQPQQFQQPAGGMPMMPGQR
jgi:hypothetical protein